MKTYKILIITVISFLAFGSTKTKAQALEDQDEIIKQKVTELLTAYANNCSFTSDKKSINQNKILEFKKLFVGEDEATLYNDIEPDKVSGETLTLDNYTKKAQMAYKMGLNISINPNKAVISKAYPFAKKKVYIVNAGIDKQVFGLYQGKRIQDFKGRLIIQITFSMKNNVPENFKILNVATPESAIEIVKEASSSKFLWGFEIMSNNTSFTQDVENYLLDAKLESQKKLSYGIEMIIPISPVFRIKTGVQLKSFESLMTINTQQNESQEDPDGDTYNQISVINITQQNTLKTITIPIDLMIVLFPKKKFNIYLNTGIAYTKINNAQNLVNGDVNVSGFYPQYNVTLENIPEYGFTSDQYTDASPNWDINSSVMFLDFGAGIMFNLGKMTLKLGYNSSSNLGDLRGNSLSYLEDMLNSDFKRLNATASGITFSILF